jgi:hypothetical protein
LKDYFNEYSFCEKIGARVVAGKPAHFAQLFATASIHGCHSIGTSYTGSYRDRNLTFVFILFNKSFWGVIRFQALHFFAKPIVVFTGN